MIAQSLYNADDTGSLNKRVIAMIQKADAKFIDAGFIDKKTGRKKKRYYLHMEPSFVESEEFPFEPGQRLIAHIENGKLVVEKLNWR